jgi:hypothetical protein
MIQQGRNMQECVTIDEKLFVHVFVISVFCMILLVYVTWLHVSLKYNFL